MLHVATDANMHQRKFKSKPEAFETLPSASQRQCSSDFVLFRVIFTLPDGITRHNMVNGIKIRHSICTYSDAKTDTIPFL